VRSTLPLGRVIYTTILPVKSSSGGDPYPVTAVQQTNGVLCPCIGNRHHRHCRHAKSVSNWLESVIPPRSLPE
jgi:hypothetical protein